MLKRIDVFARFLDDGRICLSNNAAERELRGIALGRKAWLFAGSDRGGERAAVMYTLIQTAKLNDVDPQSWLADVPFLRPDPRGREDAERRRRQGSPSPRARHKLSRFQERRIFLPPPTAVISAVRGPGRRDAAS
jgi:hypothetical protein